MYRSDPEKENIARTESGSYNRRIRAAFSDPARAQGSELRGTFAVKGFTQALVGRAFTAAAFGIADLHGDFPALNAALLPFFPSP